MPTGTAHILLAALVSLAFSCASATRGGSGAETSRPATISIMDPGLLERAAPGGVPAGWEHIKPGDDFALTNYSVEQGVDGDYLRLLSSGTRSWLEYDLDDVDPKDYPVMEWTWLVNQFPETGWEMDEKNDDFAIRIELVYDFRGGLNILNIIRKGLINVIFRGYPPELIVSYVWSLNVPVDDPYRSPSSKHTFILPIESDVAMQGRWVHETRNIRDDLASFFENDTRGLVLKKIRLRSDTENASTIAESGLKLLRLHEDAGSERE